MAQDLILGESTRNWARGSDLLANPSASPPPTPYNPATEALRKAMDFDSSLKIRPSGNGATVTKIFKWG